MHKTLEDGSLQWILSKIKSVQSYAESIAGGQGSFVSKTTTVSADAKTITEISGDRKLVTNVESDDLIIDNLYEKNQFVGTKLTIIETNKLGEKIITERVLDDPANSTLKIKTLPSSSIILESPNGRKKIITSANGEDNVNIYEKGNYKLQGEISNGGFLPNGKTELVTIDFLGNGEAKEQILNYSIITVKTDPNVTIHLTELGSSSPCVMEKINTTSTSFYLPYLGSSGEWEIKSTNQYGTVTDKVTVNDYTTYNVTPVLLIGADVSIKSVAGSSVNLIDNSSKKVIETKTANSEGIASFHISRKNSYEFFATYEDGESNHIVLTIDDSGLYSDELKFATYAATTARPSTFTLTDGTHTIKRDNTTGIFVYLPTINNWKITATNEYGDITEDNFDFKNEYIHHSSTLIYTMKYYGVRINENNHNPSTCCTYFGDSLGKSVGYPSWKNTEIMQELKPCILKDGNVVRYLDKNDYTKDINGNTVTLNDPNVGDIMVEIPKFGYKFQRNGDNVDVSLTNKPNNPDYCYLAHSLDEIGDCDKIYYGVYLSNKTGNVMYSHSGKTPTHSLVINTLRPFVSAKGDGYQLQSLYPRTLLSVLYLIVYRNLNSQQALGKGYCTNGTSCNTTGSANKKGFCWGEQSGTINNNVKLFGIEDLWGNLQDWVDGVFLDSGYTLRATYKNFNNTGANYPYSSKLPYNSDMMNKYALKCQGTNEFGFIPRIVGGTDSTGYCDYVRLVKNNTVRVGGDFSHGYNAGLFFYGLDQAPAGSTGYGQGSRIIYKHKAPLNPVANVNVILSVNTSPNAIVVATGNGESYQTTADSNGVANFNLTQDGSYMVSNNVGDVMGIPKQIDITGSENYSLTL